VPESSYNANDLHGTIGGKYNLKRYFALEFQTTSLGTVNGLWF
jgi:hypothetical protein